MPNLPPNHRPARIRRTDPRPSPAKRGYGRAWQRQSKLYLQEHPLCVMCAQRGLTVVAQHVDHIIPRAEGGADDEGNLQALCHPCHSRKTATRDGGFGR